MSGDEDLDLMPAADTAEVASATSAQADRWRELVDIIEDNFRVKGHL